MSVGEELHDPWGWVAAGVTGGLGWAVLAGTGLTGAVAVLAGAGIGAAVLATKVALGARGRGTHPDEPVRARDRLPEPPRDSSQRRMLDRSTSALARMRDLAGRPADPWIAEEAGRAYTESVGVLESMDDLARRVTLLDSSIAAARPDLLMQEIANLQAQLTRTTDPDVRREQDRALAALDSQADAIDRLLRRRDTLLAQMQGSAAGLEGLATRTGELVALGPASQDTEEATRIVAELTESLDMARQGVEQAHRVLRDL